MIVAALLLAAPLDMKAIVEAPIPVLEKRWGKASQWETWVWKGPRRDIPDFASNVAFSSIPKTRWKRDEFGICWQDTPGLRRDSLSTVSITHPDDTDRRLDFKSTTVADKMEGALKRLYRIVGMDGPEHIEGVRSFSRPTLPAQDGEWYGRLSTYPVTEGSQIYVLSACYDRRGISCDMPVPDNDGDNSAAYVQCEIQRDPLGQTEYVHYIDLPATTATAALRLVGIDTRGLRSAIKSDTLYPLPSLKGWSFAWTKGTPNCRLELERDEPCPFHSGSTHVGEFDSEDSNP